MIRPVVGLVGKKRSGKDTFAALLAREHGFARYAFADRLRAYMLALDPIVDVREYWEYGPPYGAPLSEIVAEVGWERAKDEVPEVRRLLQASGDGLRRYGPADVWLRPVMEDVAEETRPVVVTDVRYRNEAEAIERAGGTLVRIVRPGTATGDAHRSETDLDDYPIAVTVENTRDLLNLAHEADLVAGLVGA